MRWTERQRALLQGMGLRLWVPTEPAEATGSVAADSVASAAAPPRARASGATRAVDTDVAVAERADPFPDPAAAAGRVARAPVFSSPVARSSDAADSPSPDVQAMDWQALRATVAACTACRLCESRRQTVFGVGDTHAHWMVVGEAPGEQEDAQGEPFVGKSGQLLDNMLRAIGVGRTARPDDAADADADADAAADPAHRAYIANTVKCRPPGNRNPAPDELARCEPYLLRQIELLQPKIILAMGRFAVQGLLRSDEPVGRLRGRVHRYHDVPLVVTYHPAYLLRNPEDKAKAWDDLCLAVETLRAAAATVP